MKGQLHHIEIYVSNLEESIRFWSWFLIDELEYEIHQQWNEGISYKLAHNYLVFVQTEEKFLKNGYHRKRTGLNHLAFWAESKEQVDRLVKKLKERNIPLLYSDRHPHAGGREHYAIFFEDPDRIKVELVAP